MMGEPESREDLHALLDRVPPDRLATIGGWIRMMARKPGTATSGAASAGPLTDMLHIRRVKSEAGRAVFELDVCPEVMNPNGVLAGPAVYAMVDYSMGAATASALEAGNYCATIEIKMSYLSSVRSGIVRAETEVIRKGRQIVFLESKVRDEAGKLIATASGSFMVIPAAAAK
jgi:acyl-CoA thioesterase